MADEYKDVRRVQEVDRTTLEATLKTKMIGLANETGKEAIGMKSSSGDMKYAPVEGNSASYSDVTVEELAGTGDRNIGVDANGKIIQMPEAGDVPDNVKAIIDGFTDQDNVDFVTETYDSGGGVYVGRGTLSTVTAVDNTYFCNGIEYTMTAGVNYVVELGAEEGEFWVLLVDGVLTKSNTYITGQTSVQLCYWNNDDTYDVANPNSGKRFIKNIDQFHGVNMSEATHENMHFTEGSKVDAGLDNLRLINFTTGSTGATNAEYQYTRTDGRYRDEDIPYELTAGNGWGSVFYKVGDNDRRHVPLGVDAWDQYDSYLMNSPSGRPYYNADMGGGVRGLEQVGEGKFFFMLHFVVGGRHVANADVSIMGQSQYDTVNEARLHASSEFKRLVGENSSLFEIGKLGIVMYQASDLFTNARKCKIVPLSYELEGVDQPYYDLRYLYANETLLLEAIPDAGFETIAVYTWARYDAFYGACANDIDTVANDFTGATTFSISRNSQNGNNNNTVLEAFPENGTFRLQGALSGTQVTVTIDGVLTKTSNIFNGAIDSFTLDAGLGFTDAEQVLVSQQAVSESTGEVRTSDTDQTYGYTSEKITGSSVVDVSVSTDGGTGAETLVIDLVNDYVKVNDGIEPIQDSTFGDNALIFKAGPNIDHLWHDDNTNTYHLVSDNTYKSIGNANLQLAELNGENVDNFLYRIDLNENDINSVLGDYIEKVNGTGTGETTLESLAVTNATGNTNVRLLNEDTDATSRLDIGTINQYLIAYGSTRERANELVFKQNLSGAAYVWELDGAEYLRIEEGGVSLPNTTIDDINGAGLKAVVTKEYVDDKVRFMNISSEADLVYFLTQPVATTRAGFITEAFEFNTSVTVGTVGASLTLYGEQVQFSTSADIDINDGRLSFLNIVVSVSGTPTFRSGSFYTVDLRDHTGSSTITLSNCGFNYKLIREGSNTPSVSGGVLTQKDWR